MDTNKQRNRDRVLSIARALINEEGYEEATIRKIGAIVKLAPASVLETFPSKRDLFYEVIRQIEEPVYQELEKILKSPEKPLEERVSLALKTHYRAHKHELRLICEIIAYAFVWDAQTEARDQRRLASLAAAFSQAFGDVFPADAPFSAALEGLVGGYFFLLRRARLNALDQAVVERGIDRLVEHWWPQLKSPAIG